MKKTLTLLLVGLAFGAQALSFDWASAAKISFDGSTDLATAGKITAHLIYLSTDTSATVKTETDGFTVSGTEVATAVTKSSSVTWYNLSSTVYRVPATADDTTTGLSGTFTHSFTMNDKGTALSAGGGWTAVPEPSTAALALAGLALLLKRRKA